MSVKTQPFCAQKLDPQLTHCPPVKSSLLLAEPPQTRPAQGREGPIKRNIGSNRHFPPVCQGFCLHLRCKYDQTGTNVEQHPLDSRILTDATPGATSLLLTLSRWGHSFLLGHDPIFKQEGRLQESSFAAPMLPTVKLTPSDPTNMGPLLCLGPPHV